MTLVEICVCKDTLISGVYFFYIYITGNKLCYICIVVIWSSDDACCPHMVFLEALFLATVLHGFFYFVCLGGFFCCLFVFSRLTRVKQSSFVCTSQYVTMSEKYWRDLFHYSREITGNTMCFIFSVKPVSC